MAVKENKVRKLVTLDKDVWDEIENYRFSARMKSESDAMRSLLGLGLIKMREMLDAFDGPKRKGKKR